MSDGFDKEAEREKLREKFAEDEQKREHTQRMSELLLKGATMTNRHCDDCGDPIFRQDGREFCPTCHTVDAADVSEAADTAETAGSAGTADAADTSAADTSAIDASAAREKTTDSGESAATGASNGEAGATAGNASMPTGDASRTTRETPAITTESGTGGVADARASLTRTLIRFARAAEDTDDPRRAREHLRAAREAAETLAALD